MVSNSPWQCILGNVGGKSEFLLRQLFGTLCFVCLLYCTAFLPSLLCCASYFSVIQLSSVPKLKTSPCVWKNSAEPMLSVCLGNKEDPELKGGEELLIRKYVRFGVEVNSGFSVCFDFFSVSFMIKEDTFVCLFLVFFC